MINRAELDHGSYFESKFFSYSKFHFLPCICWAGSSHVQWLVHPPSACGPWPVCTGLSSALYAMENCTGPFYKKNRDMWSAHRYIMNHFCTNMPWLRYSLFIEEVKSLGLLRRELREGATPLHQAARGVVFQAGLGLRLLYRRGTGGGAKESAEAAGGRVT